MEDMMTKAQHEEFAKLMKSENERLADENRRQNKRLEALEDTVRQIGNLTASVQELASSMKSMLKEQEKQGKRLETLEGRDGEMWRKVVSHLITTAAGILLGYIFMRLGIN
jgi:chromosome segregation ATPase